MGSGEEEATGRVVTCDRETGKVLDVNHLLSFDLVFTYLE